MEVLSRILVVSKREVSLVRRKMNAASPALLLGCRSVAQPQI